MKTDREIKVEKDRAEKERQDRQRDQQRDAPINDTPAPAVPEKNEKTSAGIRRAAADILEQRTHRPRAEVEADISMGTGIEAVTALVAAILNHLDAR